MHPGTCVTHVPWCMTGSLTEPAVAVETFPAFPMHAQPAILHIGSEAHDKDDWLSVTCLVLLPSTYLVRFKKNDKILLRSFLYTDHPRSLHRQLHGTPYRIACLKVFIRPSSPFCWFMCVCVNDYLYSYPSCAWVGAISVLCFFLWNAARAHCLCFLLGSFFHNRLEIKFIFFLKSSSSIGCK